MIDEKLLELIRCPFSGQNMTVADASVIADLNEKIAQGNIRDHADQLVEGSLDEGLITEDGARLYPVRGGIPTLIADNAIPLEST